MKPPRAPLFDFPDVLIHAEESAVKCHADFRAGKAGDISAAERLVASFVNTDRIERILDLLDRRPVELVSVHALETTGVNEIPAALAAALAKQLAGRLELRVSGTIVQANSVGHTGASGYQRLAHQAQFVGAIAPGHSYFLVDDFVGRGAHWPIGSDSFTASAAKLAPDDLMIQALRNKHGNEFEQWWGERFGFGFDCLTRSKDPRMLTRSEIALLERDLQAALSVAGIADWVGDDDARRRRHGALSGGAGPLIARLLSAGSQSRCTSAQVSSLAAASINSG